MATGNGIDYGWFKYTDDDGLFWSVKCDKDWGTDASSGLAEGTSATPWPPEGGRFRRRMVLLRDPVSGRTTRRVLGTPSASAGTPGQLVVTKARGATGSYTLTSLGKINERQPHHGPIVSKAEPITT